MDSPMLSHESRHRPGESRTSSRPGRPAVSASFRQYYIDNVSMLLFS